MAGNYNFASIGAMVFVLSQLVMSTGATTELVRPGLSHFYVPKVHFGSPLPSWPHLPGFTAPSFPPLPSRRSLAESPRVLDLKLKDIVINVGEVDIKVPIPPLSSLPPLSSIYPDLPDLPDLPSKPDLPGSMYAFREPRETHN